MQQQMSPLNILVADDEKSTAKASCYILEHAGHKVDVVHDGQEALELLKNNPDKYQLLITDHSMPKMSGLQFVENLLPTQFHGRIVVFSGYLTEDVECSFRNLGVRHFLKKPFDLKQLPNLAAQIA
jgi:CheY-like chemotaxis protein